jgi:hypothetical protein
MKSPLFPTLILAFVSFYSYGQDNRYFQLQASGHKVKNSLYKTITLLDKREDTTFIGIIDPGKTPDKVEKYLFQSPVQPQLTALMDTLTDNTAKDGQLLFLFRRFNFIEKTGSRFCYLSAILYAKQADRYTRLSVLDTTIVLTGSVRELNGLASKMISVFVSKSLLLDGSDGETRSYADLRDLDNLTKQTFPLYTSTQYAEGIYNSSVSFLRQTPDWQGYVDTNRDNSIAGLYMMTSKGNRMHTKHQAFAVVYHGVPYISTAFGFYPIEKSGGNIYFTGDVRIPVRDGTRAVAQAAFGLMGSAIAGQGYRATYRLILDPVAGRFIHLEVLNDGTRE